MKQRILTALVLAPLAIGAVLWLPTDWFMLLVGSVLLLGLWEWTRLIGLRSTAARAAVLAVNAAAMLWLGWLGRSDLLQWVAFAGVAWWALATIWLRHSGRGRGPGSGRRLVKLLAGTLMVLPTWAAIMLLHDDPDHGPRWALFAVFLVWAADTFAYFAGSRIGGPKLAPAISPGKTWAGFWGGLTGAVLICIPALPLLGLAWSALPALLLLGLCTAIASVIGDLFESLIKRHSGAKDSSALIPGHGGLLDRVDSLLAALPVFAIGRILLDL